MIIRRLPKPLLFLLSLFNIISCSKTGTNENGNTPPPVTDKCLTRTITISTTTTAAVTCTNTGGITITATGSTNFTYKLNSSGTFQAANTFTNVASGVHTVFVKDGDGCEKTAAVTVSNSGQPGPLFAEVRALITARCQSCHNTTQAQGNVNWELDCNIVANKARIKARAVDENSMPPGSPLSEAEKKKITDWIAAGGGITN